MEGAIEVLWSVATYTSLSRRNGRVPCRHHDCLLYRSPVSGSYSTVWSRTPTSSVWCSVRVQVRCHCVDHPFRDTEFSFRYSHIPLTLLYSSLTKLFLLFLLAIWRPAPIEPSIALPTSTEWHPLVSQALALLDEDRLDREWIVRNVLGGMSAGFGLRGDAGLTWVQAHFALLMHRI